MSLDNLIIMVRNFYFTHTYPAWAILVGLALFLYFKPKEALKILGVIFACLLVIYCFSVLGKSASTGMSNEKKMVNQTVNKLK